MAASLKCDLMTKYRLEFNRMTSSQYSVYKKPRNLYENLINTLSVSRKQTRKDINVYTCPLETTYREWKERQFPEVEIAGEIMKACKYLDDLKNSPGENDVVEESFNKNKKNGLNVKHLYEILQSKGGSEVAIKMEQIENLDVVCQKVNPMIEDYLNKDRPLSDKATYFQPKSTLSMKKEEASDLIGETKKKMETLYEYETKTIAELSKFVAHCSEKSLQLKNELIQNLLNLQVLLEDLIRRYNKRISNLKIKTAGDLIDIRAENSDKSWEDCIH